MFKFIDYLDYYLFIKVISDIVKEGCWFIHPYFITYGETEEPTLYNEFKNRGPESPTFITIFTSSELYKYISNVNVISHREFSEIFWKYFRHCIERSLTKSNLERIIQFIFQSLTN